MLNVEQVNQYYGGSHILRGLGFEAKVGEVTVVLGRNGEYGPSAQTWSRLSRILLASLGMGALMAAASHYRDLIEAPLRDGGLSVRRVPLDRGYAHAHLAVVGARG